MKDEDDKLIAAASDMYKALLLVVDEFDFELRNKYEKAAILEARKAIKKARGEL